jgi:glycosyltransferase involved in cell wall biosynthesis
MLSVVIPTLNRREILLRTLRSLERQTVPTGGFEVIVADNGSGDGSQEAVREFAGRSRHPIRLVEEPLPGPGPARNRGLREASGELVLFLGDDMEPASGDLIDSHVQLHRQAGHRSYGVLGRVIWSPKREVTPFMEWLDRTDFQFGFHHLRAGPVSPPDAFWTAHVSVRRELLDRAGGFDERLRHAQDVELGLRLERLGMVLDYHPELLVLHDHPTSLPTSLARLQRIGHSAALLHRLQPGFDGFSVPRGARWQLARAAAPAFRAIAAIGWPRRLKETAWMALHKRAYARGYRQGASSP